MSKSQLKETSSNARDELGETQPPNGSEGRESERSGSRAGGSRSGGAGRSSPKKNKTRNKVLAFNSTSIHLGNRSRSYEGGEAERSSAGGARGGARSGEGVRGGNRGKRDKRGGGASRPGLGGPSLGSTIGTGRCLTDRRRDSTGVDPSPFGGRSSLTPRSPVKKAERKRKTPPEGELGAEQRRKVRGGVDNDLTGTDELTSSDEEGCHLESEPPGVSADEPAFSSRRLSLENTLLGDLEAQVEGGGGEASLAIGETWQGGGELLTQMTNQLALSQWSLGERVPLTPKSAEFIAKLLSPKLERQEEIDRQRSLEDGALERMERIVGEERRGEGELSRGSPPDRWTARIEEVLLEGASDEDRKEVLRGILQEMKAGRLAACTYAARVGAGSPRQVINNDDFFSYRAATAGLADPSAFKGCLRNVQEREACVFDSTVGVHLAHCVSKDLRMSAGVAEMFVLRYGRVDELERQEAAVGNVAVLRGVKDISGARVKKDRRAVYYLITKARAGDRPMNEDIFKALVALKHLLLEENEKEVAIPRLATGLDGKSWLEIRGMLNWVFQNTGISITACHRESDRRRLGSKFVVGYETIQQAAGVSREVVRLRCGTEDCGPLRRKIQQAVDPAATNTKVTGVTASAGGELVFSVSGAEANRSKFVEQVRKAAGEGVTIERRLPSAAIEIGDLGKDVNVNLVIAAVAKELKCEVDRITISGTRSTNRMGRAPATIARLRVPLGEWRRARAEPYPLRRVFIPWYGWCRAWDVADPGRGCYACGKQGHVATRYPTGPCCYRCGKVGHVVAGCPEKALPQRGVDRDPQQQQQEVLANGATAGMVERRRCRTCNEQGHLAAKCPTNQHRLAGGGEGNAAAGRPEGAVRLTSIPTGTTGAEPSQAEAGGDQQEHESTDVNVPSGPSWVRCFKCRKVGHTEDECPTRLGIPEATAPPNPSEVEGTRPADGKRDGGEE